MPAFQFLMPPNQNPSPGVGPYNQPYPAFPFTSPWGAPAQQHSSSNENEDMETSLVVETLLSLGDTVEFVQPNDYYMDTSENPTTSMEEDQEPGQNL